AVAVDRALLDEEAQTAQVRVEAERVRNALLSAVSHDLRTPLTAITGAASAALEGETRIDAVTRRELLESIRDEAERLNRLVNNLLDVTRLESGNLQLRREWIPVEELVGVALARLATPLRDRKLTTRLPEDLPPVHVDGLLVEQVFINLIENATKHPQTGQPDIVILDLGLPDLDGLDVIRKVREWSAVPVIVLSARGQEADKVAALDAGADDYLSKPFGVGELMARMRVALRHRARVSDGAL